MPATRVVIVGCGATGAQIARQLVSITEVTLIDERTARAASVARALGGAAQVASALDEVPADVVVLALPNRHHFDLARRALRGGAHVVTLTDDLEEAQTLVTLDRDALQTARSLVIGAGFAPGLTCLLARVAAARFDTVEEIHVAKHGTGGPACARQHHAALASSALDWRDAEWVRRPGGSGRELLWFPEPVKARDCYRAALCDAFLLQPAFATVNRLTSRMSATRRDRLTAGLPMLAPPHEQGGIGAVRVEVRGRIGGEVDVAVLGAAERPAVAAAAVAASAVEAIVGGAVVPGAGGLAMLAPEPRALLGTVMGRGLRVFVFDGQPRPAANSY